MNRTQWSRILLLAGGLLAVIPVKCNSIFDRSRPAENDGSYQYVMVSGSMIPQRVPTGQRLVTPSPVDVYGGDALRETLQKNRSVGKLPGAGN
jgi:hypothetical protein